MKKVATVLLTALLLAGCGSNAQFLPIIDASLQGAKGVTEAGRILSEADKNVVGCFVAASFLTAIGSAQSAIDGWSKGDATGVIPSVEVDLSSCLVLSGAPMEPVIEANAKIMIDALAAGILPAIESIVMSIMEGDDASCQEKAVARAAFAYVGAVRGPLAEELHSPDGKLSIPEVALEACP
jgi:hypothetical protein